MKDENLREFFARVADRAARQFSKEKSIGCTIYHAVKPGGDEVIFPQPPGDKDRSIALAREVLKAIDAARVAIICEAWVLDARTQAFDIAKINREGVARQPGRIEILLIAAEDQVEGSLMARREIIRHDGRVILGKLTFIEHDGAEGRMAGMLPSLRMKH